MCWGKQLQRGSPWCRDSRLPNATLGCVRMVLGFSYSPHRIIHTSLPVDFQDRGSFLKESSACAVAFFYHLVAAPMAIVTTLDLVRKVIPLENPWPSLVCVDSTLPPDSAVFETQVRGIFPCLRRSFYHTYRLLCPAWWRWVCAFLQPHNKARL